MNRELKTENSCGFTLISAGRLARLKSSQWRSSDINVQPQRGFTLIELLIVIFVLSILGLAAAQLFTDILKGTNKAAVISEVKQNGQFISDTLERHIRAATNVIVLGNELILTKDVGSVTFTFTPAVDIDSDGDLDENGKITITDPGQSLSDSPIANTDPVAGVDVTTTTAVFTLLPDVANAPQVVQVDITLNQGVKAPTRNDFRANVRLVNTYSLRTY